MFKSPPRPVKPKENALILLGMVSNPGRFAPGMGKGNEPVRKIDSDALIVKFPADPELKVVADKFPALRRLSR